MKDEKAIRILNRIVEWRSDGLWYEADQTHAEIFVKELGMEEVWSCRAPASGRS